MSSSLLFSSYFPVDDFGIVNVFTVSTIPVFLSNQHFFLQIVPGVCGSELAPNLSFWFLIFLFRDSNLHLKNR
jgi:hypothetical protein